MIRATTPTHTFTFPFDITETCKEMLITYSQHNCNLINKRLKDCTITGKTAKLMLSQIETASLREDQEVLIQVRVLTKDGEALASQIYRLPVQRVLNDEVLR